MGKIIFYIVAVLVLLSCKKEEEPAESNPYNDPSLKPPVDTTIPVIIDSSSFQFLYYHVFKPTCANSGCHDGTFQPDFRTLYSSYNTLVKHSVIQNDLAESFLYRVEPYNLQKSLLHERLNRFMTNTSGVMPLSVEPGSEWLTDSAIFKKLINEWILKGAPDSYGNLPGEANPKPQVIGIMAFPTGTTSNPYSRLSGSTSPISVPTSASIDVWFALSDDETDAADFNLAALKSSYDLFDFKASVLLNLSKSASISGKDFWDNTVSYTHKVNLSFPTDTIGTFIYLRTYLQDDEQTDTTEIPNDGTNDIMRSYFTIKVDSV